MSKLSNYAGSSRALSDAEQRLFREQERLFNMVKLSNSATSTEESWEEVGPSRAPPRGAIGGSSLSTTAGIASALTLSTPSGISTDDARIECCSFLAPRSSKGGLFCDKSICDGRHNFTLARLVSTRLLWSSWERERDDFLLPACEDWVRFRRCGQGSLCVSAHPAPSAIARLSAPEGAGQLCWDARLGDWVRCSKPAASNAIVFWDLEGVPFPSPRTAQAAPSAQLLLHALSSTLRTAIGVPPASITLSAFAHTVTKSDAAAFKSARVALTLVSQGASIESAFDTALALTLRTKSIEPNTWAVLITGERDLTEPASALARKGINLMILTCGSAVGSGEASAALVGPADVILMHAIHQGGNQTEFNNKVWNNKPCVCGILWDDEGGTLLTPPFPPPPPSHQPSV